MSGIEIAIAIASGIIILVGKEVAKIIKIKKEKKKIKENLIEAFKKNNPTKIKKYIGYIKDFDKKYGTSKAQKYLDKIIRNTKGLNEENVLSLLVDYSMIDRIYDEKIVIDNDILEIKLNEKLDLMERRRKETILRGNMLSHKMQMKSQRMNKRNGKGSLG